LTESMWLPKCQRPRRAMPIAVVLVVVVVDIDDGAGWRWTGGSHR
jgi:hypothetical protein